MKTTSSTTRRDNKRRILRPGEFQREDGRYQFKYQAGGKAHTVYSWKLEETDPLPKGKRACKSLRLMEKELDVKIYRAPHAYDAKKTVLQIAEKYVATKTNARKTTKMGYNTVLKILRKDDFGNRSIGSVTTSDAKEWLIGLQTNGKHYSSIHTIRSVVRQAFQTAVEDEILARNPFSFELKDVLINDSVRREAISKKDKSIFLNFVKNDNCYKKYYDGVYILFHTGLRISEFCGLTIHDVDMENKIINIDHQLQRVGDGILYIEKTKTNAGTRKLPMTDDVYECFQRILESRKPPKVEPIIDGYSQFLFFNKDGRPTVAMDWEHYFKHMVDRHNKIYQYQLPKITPHVCRHTYCTEMAITGISPKTLQYLMGHSDISITLNVYTHLKFDDAQEEMAHLQALREKEIGKARKELEDLGKATSTVVPMRKKA